MRSRGCAYALRLALLASLAAAACAPDSRPAPLRIETARAGGDTRLTLVGAPGLRVNARLKPALELADGTILRFDSPHLTPDSAYFAEPPTARLAGQPRAVHGRLRASVCDPGAEVCHTLALEL